MEKMHCYLFHC